MGDVELVNAPDKVLLSEVTLTETNGFGPLPEEVREH
jgi:hypothetical protein